jgi:hypothetical protein
MVEGGSPAAASGGVTPGLASIKLPQFWQNALAAWFRTVEAQFMIRAITDPVDKYYVVMAALSEQQSELVSSVLDEEPTANSYSILKAALVASHTLTTYQMVDKLVNLESLGGSKPSELMAAMQKLRPPKDEHFFIYHFLQRLPKEVRILLAHNDFTDTRKLAEKADGLMAIHQPQAAEVTALAAATADQQPPDSDTVAAAAARSATVAKAGGRRTRAAIAAAASRRRIIPRRRYAHITSDLAIRPTGALSRVRGRETSRPGRC